METHTIEGLANAVSYYQDGTPSAEKFYAYATEDGSPNGSVIVSSGGWGDTQQDYGVRSDTIGSGKTNSIVMTSRLSSYIWGWLRDTINANSTNGHNDWFVGSRAELEELRLSSTPAASIFTEYGSYKDIWTSVETYDSSKEKHYAKYWWALTSATAGWSSGDRSTTRRVIAIRSF